MDLSIIIINYNTFNLTCNCLASVFNSVKNIDFEVILVDNASSECPPSVFKEKFPEIILLPQQSNLGFAGGNNAGLTAATGNIVLLLNSDTEIVGDAINVSYDYLVKRQEVGVMSCKLVYPSGEVQGCCQRFPTIALEFYELSRIQKLFGKRRAKIMQGFFFDHLTEMEAGWVWGTFFMIRRDVIDKLKDRKFPDDYFMYGEDMQWCYIIHKMGYKIMYYPAGTVIHYVSMSSSSDINFDKQRLMMDHEFSFLKTSYGGVSARLIFVLRSLNYFTLFRYGNRFIKLGKQYFRRAVVEY